MFCHEQPSNKMQNFIEESTYEQHFVVHVHA